MSKRHQDRHARRAEDTAASATSAVAVAAGSAAQRAAAAVQRAGTAIEHHGRTSAPGIGSAVGTAVETAVDAGETARELAGRWTSAATGLATELADTVHGLVEQPGARTGAALDALRGVPVRPPAARRRWPWAVVAAVSGAVAGAAVAGAVRRWGSHDAPGAQEPHELRAVVDVASGTQPERPLDGPRTPASPA